MDFFSEHVASSPTLTIVLLLVPIALGLCIYAFAFCSQRVKRRLFGQSLSSALHCRGLHGVQHIHISLFLLLAVDAIAAILGILYTAFVLNHICKKPHRDCPTFFKIWAFFRWISLSQNLITALVGVRFLYSPHLGPRFLLLGTLLLLPPVVLGVMLAEDIFNFLLIMSILFACMNDADTRMAKQSRAVGVLALVTYVFVCFPNTLVCRYLLFLFIWTEHGYQVITLAVFIPNFYFVPDALMFYLLLKIKEVEEVEEDEDPQ